MEKGIVGDAAEAVKELISSVLNFFGDILDLLFGWL